VRGAARGRPAGVLGHRGDDGARARPRRRDQRPAAPRRRTAPAPMSDDFGGETALVLFSGGQDSTVCLAWALARFARVETIGFDYGQRHRVELDCRPPLRAALAALAPSWAQRLGADHVLDLGVLGRISDTALTRDAE